MIGLLTKFKKIRVMLKNILKLKGAQKLTENEQKSINGGFGCIRIFYWTMTAAECAEEGGIYNASTGKCAVKENICV
jgi:hypothetical protein